MPYPFYPASAVLFMLHRGMISHMPVLATPSSTVNNTNTWILTTETILDLAACSRCRDVASRADRHLDITFGLQVVESSSLVSVLFKEAFSHP